MLRILTVISLIAATFLTNLRGAEVLVDPAALPAALARIQSDIAEGGRITCAFTESRSFPFKKTPSILEGESDYMHGEGIVLRYASPEKRIIGIRGNGIVETDSSGVKKFHELPRQYENMLSLYDLDIRKLADGFNIYFDGDDHRSWAIRLAEKQGLVTAGRQREARTAPLGITIRGEGGAIRSFEIVKPGAITIAIRMENARRMTPEETAAAAETLKP